MLLTSTRHKRLERAYLQAAAKAELPLEEKRRLQAAAKRHKILADKAREIETGKDQK